MKRKYHPHRHASVGKTTVGKAIGKEMGRNWFDVDHELEKEIGDISTYITEQGEAAFRGKEAEMDCKIRYSKQALSSPLVAAV